MTYLVIGLIIFLGVHSLRVVADDWRNVAAAAIGVGPWKALYGLTSLAGVVLIVWGYELARGVPVELWQGPTWARHMAGLLTLVAAVLITASFVPSSRIRALVGHPMVAGVMVWSVGHLLANGRLADLVLFGGFLVWSIVVFVSLRKRDRAAGTKRGADAGGWVNDSVTVLIALVAWYVFALYIHRPLIGVPPFG